MLFISSKLVEPYSTRLFQSIGDFHGLHTYSYSTLNLGDTSM